MVRQNFNFGWIAVIVFFALAQGFYSCEKVQYTPPSVDPDKTWSFQTDIQPVFNKNCVSCHGGVKAPDLREGKSYLALTRGGYVNSPAETSRLFSTMSSSDHRSRSNETERLKVLYWITQGARNN